jgi:hypothetical protein
MRSDERKYYWRGPLPPYPAKVDLVAWLLMRSEERRQRLRRHWEADVPIMEYTEADVARMTDNGADFWDHWAGLLDMDAEQRAEEVRADIERACADMRKLSVEERADEVERQVQRWAPFWDKVAAEAANRSQGAAGEKRAP